MNIFRGFWVKFLFAIFFLFFGVLQLFSNLEAGEAEVITASTQAINNLENQEPLNGEEIDWFEKFMEGSYVVEGWNDITLHILDKISLEEREKQQLVLKKLGNRIGREWAKDNDIRKIDTIMLKKWGAFLKKTAEEYPERLLIAIAELKKEVDCLLSSVE